MILVKQLIINYDKQLLIIIVKHSGYINAIRPRTRYNLFFDEPHRQIKVIQFSGTSRNTLNQHYNTHFQRDIAE